MSGVGGATSFLARERSVAPATYDRWLVPPAALAIHLAIGQAYSFSVFNLPLTKILGVTQPAGGDWKLTQIVWIFNIAFAMLGLSAALFGTWLERVGPRRAMFTAALCFCGGLEIAAAGVHLHSMFLVYLGYGAVGGVGLGLGYISPVSTLIKWFPDRPGMATGLAIMGFGGGALIGAPLATTLMDHFKSAHTAGVSEAFATMGALYFVLMLFGAFTVRVPPPDWAPPAHARSTTAAPIKAAGPPVAANEAIQTPQFWLLWAVLFLNVTAGIGVLSQASPMIQEVFPQRITASSAAGFVGLLSLFNLAGRFLWSSLSDVIGRKATYMIYFALGAVLYVSVPSTSRLGSVALFVACFAVILSMYGGGFATIPAYLRDLFGVYQVGAIHGRLLTAWSAAAIAGPSLVTYVREWQLAHGMSKAQVYNVTMYLMAGLLVIGFVCNAAVRPVDPRHHRKD